MSTSTLAEPVARTTLLTPEQAGKLVGASRNTVRNCIFHGLPTIERGSRKLIEQTAFLEWFARERPNFGKKKDRFHAIKRPDDPAKGGIIYGLTDPRPEYARKPVRYIGQTGDLKNRLRLYRCDHGHSPALRNWFKKLKRLGLTFGMVVLDTRLFGIGQAEREWIAKGRAKGWPLLNITEGGECGGGSQRPEVRSRLSEISKAKWQEPGYRERWLAAMERCSQWNKRTPLTPEEQERREANKRQQQENMRIHAEREAAKAERGSWVFVPLTHNGAAFIPLTRGQWATVDAEDWPRLSRFKWHAQLKGGKYWRAKRPLPLCRCMLLNREVMRARDGEAIVHKNGNQLDCRRRNLVRRRDAA